jgi:hypothetical protein
LHFIIVLEENFDDSLPAVVDKRVFGNEVVFEKQSRHFLLDVRRRNAHRSLLRLNGVPYPCKHVSNLIRHALFPFTTAFSTLKNRKLPARLNHAGYQTAQRHLPEADPAQAETAKVSALSSAPPATIVFSGLELRRFPAFFHHRFSCHYRLSCR